MNNTSVQILQSGLHKDKYDDLFWSSSYVVLASFFVSMFSMLIYHVVFGPSEVRQYETMDGQVFVKINERCWCPVDSSLEFCMCGVKESRESVGSLMYFGTPN